MCNLCAEAEVYLRQSGKFLSVGNLSNWGPLFVQLQVFTLDGGSAAVIIWITSACCRVRYLLLAKKHRSGISKISIDTPPLPEQSIIADINILFDRFL